jgi:subtilisin family serine protease
MKLTSFSARGNATLTSVALFMLFLTSLILLLTSCEKIDQEITPASEGTPVSRLKTPAIRPDQEYVPNEVLVKFRPGTSKETRARLLESITGTVTEKVLTRAMESLGDHEGFLVINTPLQTMDAMAKLKKGSEEIEYAEPNYVYRHQAYPSDPYFTKGDLWGMYGGGSTIFRDYYGSQAVSSWDRGFTGSASVVVGIIDQGIQFNHPDLAGQVWTNPAEPVDGIDNDGNGYTDDIHGWDFANNNNTVYDGTSDYHGTHVAGTIGAKSNGLGVVGMNWNITMISCKFMGGNSGTTANAVKACDYLTDLKTRHAMKIVASNNSWGGGGYSQALYDAIGRANAKNILFVAAAGNYSSDNDAFPFYPASYNHSNVISIGAITKLGFKASYSNYGATSVDIGAPGDYIYSTVPGGGYAALSGTSMATPHVTGGVALYAARFPRSSAATIKTAILFQYAVLTNPLFGKWISSGRLNVNY